jgi:transposase
MPGHHRAGRRARAPDRALVDARAPRLLDIPGCGAPTAATIVAETARVDRFPTEGHFARYAGTAPIPASSGARFRHRHNRRGNRQMNAAMHRIAVTRIRIYQPARDYLERKRSQGESEIEALRALKRHITRVVFKTLISMDQPAPRLTADAA